MTHADYICARARLRLSDPLELYEREMLAALRAALSCADLRTARRQLIGLAMCCDGDEYPRHADRELYADRMLAELRRA